MLLGLRLPPFSWRVTSPLWRRGGLPHRFLALARCLGWFLRRVQRVLPRSLFGRDIVRLLPQCALWERELLPRGFLVRWWRRCIRGRRLLCGPRLLLLVWCLLPLLKIVCCLGMLGWWGVCPPPCPLTLRRLPRRLRRSPYPVVRQLRLPRRPWWMPPVSWSVLSRFLDLLLLLRSPGVVVSCGPMLWRLLLCVPVLLRLWARPRRVLLEHPLLGVVVPTISSLM